MHAWLYKSPYYICVKNYVLATMTSTKLQDDLLKDFKEQKKMIYEQVELLDPLGTSLRRPAAQRLISKGVLIFSEILCYLLAVGAIVVAVFMDMLYPFYVVAEIHREEYSSIGKTNIDAFTYGMYALFGLIAILFYMLARAARAVRLKNNILNLAGKNIKLIVGQHLNRKASIDSIEQRHFLELPNDHLETVEVNDVPNPGYDEHDTV